MFKLISTLTLALALSFTGSALAQKSRPKIPHSHHSEHGGAVLMLGDDHVEIIRSTDGKTVQLFFSDKFRQPVAANDFKIELATLTANNRTELAFTPIADVTSGVEIPVNVGRDASTELEVKAQRLNPPKGHWVSDKAQKVAFGKIPALKHGKKK